MCYYFVCLIIVLSGLVFVIHRSTFNYTMLSSFKDKKPRNYSSMGHFSEMEWNTKWDWDHYASFGSKPLESPKKLQLSDFMIADDGEIDARSFNLSGGGGCNNMASGSDNGHVSSTKSSISASTDSSPKDGTSNFKLMAFDDCLRNINNKREIIGSDVSGNSPPLEASLGSVEPLIALELGKRTFFENNVKSIPVSALSKSYATSLKKVKSSGQNVPLPRCLVEGCNVDLSTAKEYHRKHRVCDSHSKSPKVVIGGLERRFCQQCSRFHNLSEFDEKKRSCRKRLSEHNARRRKPPQETIHFNPTRLSSSSFYGSGGRQQASFFSNNASLLQPRTSSPNPTWDNTFNSKFTITKGYSLKYNGDGGTNEQFHMSGVKPQNVIDIHGGKANRLLVSNPGSKGSLISSQFNAVSADYSRALSLLSTNSLPWISQPDHQSNITMMQEADNTSTTYDPMMQSIPEGVPLSSTPPEFWLSSRNQPTNHHFRDQMLPTNVNFQDGQLLRTPPYEADFYSNILN